MIPDWPDSKLVLRVSYGTDQEQLSNTGSMDATPCFCGACLVSDSRTIAKKLYDDLPPFSAVLFDFIAKVIVIMITIAITHFLVHNVCSPGSTTMQAGFSLYFVSNAYTKSDFIILNNID